MDQYTPQMKVFEERLMETLRNRNEVEELLMKRLQHHMEQASNFMTEQTQFRSSTECDMECRKIAKSVVIKGAAGNHQM